MSSPLLAESRVQRETEIERRVLKGNDMVFTQLVDGFELFTVKEGGAHSVSEVVVVFGSIFTMFFSLFPRKQAFLQRSECCL